MCVLGDNILCARLQDIFKAVDISFYNRSMPLLLGEIFVAGDDVLHEDKQPTLSE